MLQNIYYPVIRFKKIPPALGLSLGALLGLLLTAFVVGQRADQQTSQLLSEYGKSLANLTAVRAVDSSVNRDLVALHALLQDVIAQKRVVFATVRDIDNSLLVQAGEPLWDGKTQEFYAVIPLQDNYAGTVTVTLATDFQGDQAVRWAVTGTAALLALMVALAIYECFGRVWWLERKVLPQRALPSLTASEDELAAECDAEPEAGSFPSAVTSSDRVARCVLTLIAVNGEALKRQLNGDLFEVVMTEFERQVQHVVALYGGNLIGDESVLVGKVVEFYADERTSEALFQSICAAHLLNALIQNNKFRLKLNSYASVNGNVSLIKREGIFCENVETNEFLSARLDVEEIEQNVFWVRGLKAPFSDLVEQQILRLRASASS